MPIDPAGTQPGLSSPAPQPKIVHVKCRRDGCKSMKVYHMKLDQPGDPEARQRFQCVDCGHAWLTQPGGAAFNF